MRILSFVASMTHSRRCRPWVAAASAVLFASCSAYKARNAADPLIPSAPFTDLSIMYLLDPDNRGGWNDDRLGAEAQFARALRGFYIQDQADAVERRDRLQDILLAAADQHFQSWIRDLRTLVTTSHFGLDVMQITLSGLSTILTPPGTKTALAGAATIVGGVEASMDANYLADKAIDVITKGMEARRARVVAEIQGRRFSLEGAVVPVRTYTVEAAIRDALRYHAGASITAGLEEAGVATQELKAEQQRTAAERVQTANTASAETAWESVLRAVRGARR